MNKYGGVENQFFDCKPLYWMIESWFSFLRFLVMAAIQDGCQDDEQYV